MAIKKFSAAEKFFVYSGNTSDIFEIEKERDFISCTDDDFESDDETCLTNLLPFNKKREHGVLVLEVTEKCNLRCSYCIYGKKYAHERKHSNCTIRLNTAIDAIKKFAEQTSNLDQSRITFYGGEPLLAFEKITRIVQHSHELGITNFNLTTNGTLLNQDKFDFLVQHNFNLLVSIDGPREIHDLKRKYTTGEGTFMAIHENLKSLKTRHPQYYKDNVSFNCVLTSEKNNEDISAFFLNELFKYNKIKFSQLNGTADGILKLSAEEIFALIIKGEHKKHSPIITPIIETLKTIEYRRTKPYFCVPFMEKVYVRANGDIQFCEQLGSKFCRTKFFYKMQQTGSAVLKNYQGSSLFKDCKGCWANLLCTHCFRDTLDAAGKFSQKLFCKKCSVFKHNLEIIFKSYLMLKALAVTDVFDDM